MIGRETIEELEKKDPSPLKVKEVKIGNRRYVVCLNEEQANKDAFDRIAIVEALKEQLKKGDKSLVGNIRDIGSILALRAESLK